MTFLLLDVGTSSLKAALWHHGKLHHLTRTPITTSYQADHAEIPATPLLRTINTTLKTLIAQSPSPIDALLFATFSPGLVVCSPTGTVRAGCITHQDRRSIREAHEIENRLTPQEHLRRAGNRPFPGGIASTSLRWLTRHQPQIFRSPYRIGLASTLLAHHLTGQWCIDYSQAAFLGLWNIRTLSWDPDLCAAAHIRPSTLPHLHWPTSPLGTLTPTAARRLGLRPGTPVYGGLVDTSAALLTTPLIPGQLLHSAGSTDVLALLLNRPLPRPNLLCRPLGIQTANRTPWLSVATIAAGGSALDWLRSTLYPELALPTFHQLVTQITQHLDRYDPTVQCLPMWAGERLSLDQPSAQWTGLSLSTTRDTLLASTLRGLAQASATRYARLAHLHPIKNPVLFTGGNKPLGHLMHQFWPTHHQFHTLNLESLIGLAQLPTLK